MPDQKILLGQTPPNQDVGPYWKYATFTQQLLQNTKMSLKVCEQRAEAYRTTETRQKKIVALRCQIAVLEKTVGALQSATPRCVTSICRNFFERNISNLQREVSNLKAELQKLSMGNQAGNQMGMETMPEEF